MAARRYYAPDVASTAAPGTLAFDAGWENTAGALRGTARDTKDTGATAGTVIAATGVANQDVLHRQVWFGPFAPQTLSGTFRMVANVREDSALSDARSQVILKTVALDGTTVLHTLIAMDTGALASEYTTAFATARFPKAYAAGGTTIAQAETVPFYIVLEAGHRNHGTNTGNVRIHWKGDIGTDASETEGSTQGDTWFEFSVAPSVWVAASDTGTGTDTRTAYTATMTASDTGSDTETSQTTHTAADTGAGTDVVAMRSMATTDAGSGTEAIGNRTIVLADSGVGTDVASVEIVTIVIDTRPTPGTLEEVLRSHHTPIARLLFLEADLETVMHAIDATRDGDNRWLLGGTVSSDRRRDVPRTGDVSIVNRDGLYDPVNSDSLVWPNRIVRIERGVRIAGVPQYRPLITGLLDNWRVDASSGVVAFDVWSRMHQADQQFPQATTYPAGMLVDDVIRAMAELGGMGTTDAHYDLDSGGLTLSSAHTYDSHDNILQAMTGLSFDNGLDLFDDGNGVLVLRPFVDPFMEPVAWEFRTGVDAVMTDMSRSGKATQVYNRAVAVGYGADLYPIRAEQRVTNPDDPLYNPEDGSGPLGDRPRPTYTTTDVTGQQALNDLAYRLLVEGALFEESLAAAAVPIPFLSARNVVRFTGAGADDTYILDTVSIPVGPGKMSMGTRKVRSLVG